MNVTAQTFLLLSLIAMSMQVTSCEDMLMTPADRNYMKEELNAMVKETQKQLLDEIKQLKERNQELENRMETLESERNVDEVIAVTSATWSQLNDNTYIYSAYGCFLDNMTLACADNRTILVTGGDYGQFSYTCTQPDVTCCPPHTADDCTDSMEDARPQDLLALKFLCDNKTSCDFVNQGGALLGCPEPSEIDYVTVYYRCLEEPSDPPVVMYTAGAKTLRAYGVNEPVIFDIVLTNIHDAYDAKSSVFTCPVTGVYMFTMTLFTKIDEVFEADMYLEKSIIVRVHADSVSGAFNQGSNLSFVSCVRGQRVWIKAHTHDNQSMYYAMYSTFSGMLVARE